MSSHVTVLIVSVWIFFLFFFFVYLASFSRCQQWNSETGFYWGLQIANAAWKCLRIVCCCCHSIWIKLHCRIRWITLGRCSSCYMLQVIKSLNPHKDFRLWMTAEVHPKFPTILLQSSLKITFEVSAACVTVMCSCYVSAFLETGVH